MPMPKTDIVTAINGFKILKILVAVAAPINCATALTVNIQERVFTVVPQFAASVGSVGPVTLKNKPIDILAPTIAAMKSLVAHLGLSILIFNSYISRYFFRPKILCRKIRKMKKLFEEFKIWK